MAARITVRLPEELIHRARREAAAEGRTLAALIEDGLRHVLGELAKNAPRKREPLPVSTAVGGVMPGIDISDPAALQEMDDLDYIERMRRIDRSSRPR